MNGRVIERLTQASPNAQRTRHWHHPLPAVAEEVRRHVVGQGTCLPVAQIADGVVVAVVSWDKAALEWRAGHDVGPVLDRGILRDWVLEGRLEQVPAVLTVDAYITLGRLQASRSTLARLSSTARVIAAVPEPPGVEWWQAVACDFYGYTVAQVRRPAPDDWAVDTAHDEAGCGLEVSVAVKGHSGPNPACRPIAHNQRLRLEQLYDLALRTDSVPTTPTRAPRSARRP